MAAFAASTALHTKLHGPSGVPSSSVSSQSLHSLTLSCNPAFSRGFPRKFSLRGTRNADRLGCRCACAESTKEESMLGSGLGSLYGLLGLDQNVGVSEIKSAYRQMALRYHPDVCRSMQREECTQKFLEVQRAYEVLSDPEQRANYDYGLMHPLFAQAMDIGSRRRPQGCGMEGVSEAWKMQWEAQLTRLRQREAAQTASAQSWGARMRRQCQSN